MKPDNISNETLERHESLLREISVRSLRVRILAGLLWSASVFLLCMFLAMWIDWLIGWQTSSARFTSALLVFVAGAICLLLGCALPIRRVPDLLETAQALDRKLTHGNELFTAATELKRSGDSPEMQGSQAMIRQVALEASSLAEGILPTQVVPSKPVMRAGAIFVSLLVAAILCCTLSLEARVLFLRFWLPGAAISLTRITAQPSQGWIAKGEPLSITASIQGRLPRHAPVIFFRAESGSIKNLPMRPAGNLPGAFSIELEPVYASLAYQVRAGDAQTPWLRLSAADRPRIVEVHLRVTSPAYSKIPEVRQESLPRTIPVLKGSEIELSFRADQKLERVLLTFEPGKPVVLPPLKDNWYTYRAHPLSSATITAHAIGPFGLDNRHKPICQIGVYEDHPPEVRILEPAEDIAVLPGEKFDLKFEATDDFGIAAASLILVTRTNSGSTNITIRPIDLGDDLGAKKILATTRIDTRTLGLHHGNELSCIVRVTDTRQLQAETRTGKKAHPDLSSVTADPALPAAQDPNSTPSHSNSVANSSSQSSNEKAGAPPSEANSSSEGSESSEAKGSQSPPNDMTMRSLDAGQSSAGRPLNVLVDEWAGSFDGVKREKLEVAINPVLQRLKELLGNAQDRLDSVKPPASKSPGLQSPHLPPLNLAQTNLVDALVEITALKNRTAETPYAFIGLQLHNIGEAHISPARQHLDSVVIPADALTNNLSHLTDASVHLAQARAMLEGLTEKYEAVKRDHHTADTMRKVAKMHQVFIEDTQAFLGSGKTPINSYERNIAEVGEEYVKKLKELLEQKKRVMEELARALSKDPRLLRRYLAMFKVDGTSQRDQLTLLAERQKNLHQQLLQWNGASAEQQTALLSAFRLHYGTLHKDNVAAAMKLAENLEVWLPLDIKPDHPRVQAVLARARQMVQSLNPSGSSDARSSWTNALNHLRTLREEFGLLSELESQDSLKLAAYMANRLTEIESLTAAHSGQMLIADAFGRANFSKVAEVLHFRIAQETFTLGEKLKTAEIEVSSISAPIAEKASQLVRILQEEIIPPQRACLEQLAKPDGPAAERTLTTVVPAFARAEETFDELIRLIIEESDKKPPPTSPGKTPGLEAMLAMLKHEAEALDRLGIPARPLNVAIMKDWLKPGAKSGTASGSGQGLTPSQSQAQAKLAQAMAQQAKAQAEQLSKEAQANVAANLTKASPNEKRLDAKEPSSLAPTPLGPAWNQLASELEKNLIQNRGTVPPEPYRQVTEQYFKTLSESASKSK